MRFSEKMVTCIHAREGTPEQKSLPLGLASGIKRGVKTLTLGTNFNNFGTLPTTSALNDRWMPENPKNFLLYNLQKNTTITPLWNTHLSSLLPQSSQYHHAWAFVLSLSMEEETNCLTLFVSWLSGQPATASLAFKHTQKSSWQPHPERLTFSRHAQYKKTKLRIQLNILRNKFTLLTRSGRAKQKSNHL